MFPPPKVLAENPLQPPWHQLCPPASLGGRQSHWWRFGGFGVSGVRLPGMTAEKEPSTMYKSKSAGAPSDSQAREK